MILAKAKIGTGKTTSDQQAVGGVYPRRNQIADNGIRIRNHKTGRLANKRVNRGSGIQSD